MSVLVKCLMQNTAFFQSLGPLSTQGYECKRAVALCGVRSACWPGACGGVKVLPAPWDNSAALSQPPRPPGAAGVFCLNTALIQF